MAFRPLFFKKQARSTGPGGALINRCLTELSFHHFIDGINILSTELSFYRRNYHFINGIIIYLKLFISTMAEINFGDNHSNEHSMVHPLLTI